MKEESQTHDGTVTEHVSILGQPGPRSKRVQHRVGQWARYLFTLAMELSA